MPDEAVAFWEDVFRHVSRSDEWRAEIERSRLIPAYMDAQESREYWRDEEETYIDLLTGLGLMR
jgi:tripartite-type tricarboxylate transporter receptor subunit TctC